MKFISAGIVLMFLIGGCNLFQTGEQSADPFDNYDKKIKVFFSSPGYDVESATEARINEHIAALVNNAKNTVDISIYELSEPVIYNSVLDAYHRGVTVRFAGDIDNINYEGYQAFIRAGVPMTLGNPDKIMHNKYILVDGKYVVTGSMNFTHTGVYNNNENVLFIESEAVADYYKRDFETMFSNNLFGLDKIDHPFVGFESNTFVLTNDDGTMTTIDIFVVPYVGYEGSEDGTRVDYRFMEYVNNAHTSIYFAIFAFTHPDIAYAVINAAKSKGVQVYGVFDKSWHTGNEYSLHQEFIDALSETSNIHVVYDGNENFQVGNTLHGSKCHNKYMVIDAGTSDAVVLTGSYNFSKAASYKGNDENWVAIHDPEIAAMYEENLFYMYDLGASPTEDLGGDSADFQDVTVSEVMWAGSRSFIGTVSEEDKFIEIKNNTASPINVSGWQLVGTTAVSKSYRILMYIFPENTIIPANGYHVLAYSTNMAYELPETDVDLDHFLYLYHPFDQDYVFLTLKDKDSKIIDQAGAPGLSPFAGSDSPNYASMIRIGADGTEAASWMTCTNSGSYIATEYFYDTLATPGED